MTERIAQSMIEFIRESPCSYFAVSSVCRRLKEKGFEALKESDPWKLVPGGCYYVIRGGSVFSFRLPVRKPRRLRVTASHCDSPTLKLKPGKGIVNSGFVRLNVEKYGGVVLQSWIDRPLSLAGRVFVRQDDHIACKLVYPDRDLLLIPSLAPHISGPVKDLSAQDHMLPILSSDGNEFALHAVLSECGIDPDTVLGTDLFLVSRMEPAVWGLNREYLSAPRLDDQACVYTTLEGFLASEAQEDALLHCVFDNEEVGCKSKQGADSSFLRDVVDRICFAYEMDSDARGAMLSDSFLISADNAHGLHPAYPGASDPVNHPQLNGGVVLKHQAGQKYATDGFTSAVIRCLCADHEIPLQDYTNHSDVRGGYTLGNISNSHISMHTADIGLAQLAMHSSYETMGMLDPERLVRLSAAFYSDALPSLI